MGQMMVVDTLEESTRVGPLAKVRWNAMASVRESRSAPYETYVGYRIPLPPRTDVSDSSMGGAAIP